MWYRGQKIVCVDGARREGEGYGFEILPTPGSVYTVRAIEFNRPDDSVGLFLHEIRNRADFYLHGDMDVRLMEPNFRATRFRPLIHTDISVFHAIRERFSKREYA